MDSVFCFTFSAFFFFLTLQSWHSYPSIQSPKKLSICLNDTFEVSPLITFSGSTIFLLYASRFGLLIFFHLLLEVETTACLYLETRVLTSFRFSGQVSKIPSGQEEMTLTGIPHNIESSEAFFFFKVGSPVCLAVWLRFFLNNFLCQNTCQWWSFIF